METIELEYSEYNNFRELALKAGVMFSHVTAKGKVVVEAAREKLVEWGYIS